MAAAAQTERAVVLQVALALGGEEQLFGLGVAAAGVRGGLRGQRALEGGGELGLAVLRRVVAVLVVGLLRLELLLRVLDHACARKRSALVGERKDMADG